MEEKKLRNPFANLIKKSADPAGSGDTSGCCDAGGAVAKNASSSCCSEPAPAEEAGRQAIKEGDEKGGKAGKQAGKGSCCG